MYNVVARYKNDQVASLATYHTLSEAAKLAEELVKIETILEVRIVSN